ncbi:MAG: TDP-N-acetylfucosamine:lipid II N-acetylfucosaminyltransferase [Bacteroidota bacterium]
MNIHLSREVKFLNDFIRFLSKLDKNGNNLIYLNHQSGKKLAAEYSSHIRIDNYFYSNAFLKILFSKNINQLFLHAISYNYLPAILICRLKKIKINWVFFGGEFYNTFYADAYNLEAEAWYKKYTRVFRKKIYKFIIDKIDAIAHFNEAEVELVNEYLKTNLPRVPFQFTRIAVNFTTLEKYKGAAHQVKIPRALLSNSAALHHRHHELIRRFSHLKEIKFGFILSYGGHESYIKDLKEKARNAFGANVLFHEEYLSYTGYVELLSSYNIMFWNSNRTGGVGTILIGLYLGMQVYLPSGVPVFKLLKSYGIEVFDVAEFNLANIKRGANPDNPHLVTHFFGAERVRSYYKSLFL